MSETGKLWRGALVLMTGHGGGQILGLVRNFAIARLVAPEDFGVAAAFAALLSMLEAASDMAWDKLLIQAKDGEDPALMASIHSLTLARGVALALLLALAAAPLAALFGVPEASGAFAWLAAVPLLRGLVHMDVKRLQRSLKFGPEVKATLLSHLVGMVAAIAAAWHLGDYRAMLWGLAAQSFTLMAASHWLAERRYRLGLDPARLRQVFVFGWPLLLNGLVIVASAQGDRLLVGAQIGVRELALYAAAAMLINAPGLLLTRIAGALALPWLARSQGDAAAFGRRADMFGAAMALAAVAVFAPLVILGSFCVTLLFGDPYAAPPLLAGWLAVGFALRFLRGWPVSISLARGDSKNVLIANVVRLSGLAAALIVLAAGGDLVQVAAAMALGEVIALGAAILRMRRVYAQSSARSVLAAVLALGVAIMWVGVFGADKGLLASLAGAMTITTIGALATIAVSTEFRDALSRFISTRTKSS